VSRAGQNRIFVLYDRIKATNSLQKQNSIGDMVKPYIDTVLASPTSECTPGGVQVV